MITGVRTLLRYLGGAMLVGLLVVAGTWVRGFQIDTRVDGHGCGSFSVFGRALKTI